MREEAREREREREVHTLTQRGRGWEIKDWRSKEREKT